MTEKVYKETNYILNSGLIVTILIMNLTGISYIDVGENVYIDFSIIPAAVILSRLNYKGALLFGIGWGLLSTFTHPLSELDGYFTILISQVVFSLAVIFARKIKNRKANISEMNYPILFALIVHSLIFDFGVFSLLVNSWNQSIPFELIIIKIILTIVCYYMTLTLIAKQFKEVYLANQKNKKRKGALNE